MRERTLKDGRLEVQVWCRCGMSLKAAGETKYVQRLVADVMKQHEGDEHGECTSREASRARQRQYAEERSAGT